MPNNSQSPLDISRFYHWDNDNGAKEYSRRAYNLIIGLMLVWGFLIDFIICGLFYNYVPNLVGNAPLALGICFGGLIVMVVGIIINVKSDAPLISFIGYNLCVIPMGIILTVFIYRYEIGSVVLIYLVTLVVSAIMTVVASAFPSFFASLGKGLFIALVAVIVVELVLTFVIGQHLTIFDWIAAILFCGYIGFDWVRAQDRPPTLDNAIDSACALYIDIVNLFIRLLEIFGKAKR